MDKLENYRNIVENVLREHAMIPYRFGEIERRTIFDRENDAYLLYVVGWHNRRRYHGIVSHLDIIGGKIWIQRDGTEDGIATDLEAANVPKSDIVLAWYDARTRQYTEYAAA